MKWFIAALALLVVVLQYRIWASPGGARELIRLDHAVEAQREENRQLKQRNQQLSAEVRDLKQGFEAVEERARSELGLIAPNETYYQVVPPESTRAAPPPGEDLAPEAGAALAAAAR
jgi:cell division protein FtsB